MTSSVHYDLLRNRRIRSKADLVVGKTYLVCHVPFDNPITDGCVPFCKALEIVELSQDNETPRFREAGPVYKNQCLNWRHCEDHGMDTTRDAWNFLLDLEQLYAEGIEVLHYTSVPYTISEELRLERAQEDALWNCSWPLMIGETY